MRMSERGSKATNRHNQWRVGFTPEMMECYPVLLWWDFVRKNPAESK
jgi:hypothetical protein